MTLYEKFFKRELVRYLVAGVSTTLVNVLLYSGLLLLGMRFYIANLIAIIVAKVYGYFVNKLFVFQSYGLTWKENIRELVTYCLMRGGTGVFDYVAVFILVEYLSFSPFYSKYGVMMVVIVLNYICSRFWVFRK